MPATNKYYKLLAILIKKGITKTQLRSDLGLDSNTIAKFLNHEPVSFEVLNKLCIYLNVKPRSNRIWKRH